MEQVANIAFACRLACLKLANSKRMSMQLIREAIQLTTSDSNNGQELQCDGLYPGIVEDFIENHVSLHASIDCQETTLCSTLPNLLHILQQGCKEHIGVPLVFVVFEESGSVEAIVTCENSGQQQQSVGRVAIVKLHGKNVTDESQVTVKFKRSLESVASELGEHSLQDKCLSISMITNSYQPRNNLSQSHDTVVIEPHQPSAKEWQDPREAAKQKRALEIESERHEIEKLQQELRTKMQILGAPQNENRATNANTPREVQHAEYRSPGRYATAGQTLGQDQLDLVEKRPLSSKSVGSKNKNRYKLDIPKHDELYSSSLLSSQDMVRVKNSTSLFPPTACISPIERARAAHKPFPGDEHSASRLIGGQGPPTVPISGSYSPGKSVDLCIDHTLLKSYSSSISNNQAHSQLNKHDTVEHSSNNSSSQGVQHEKPNRYGSGQAPQFHKRVSQGVVLGLPPTGILQSLEPGRNPMSEGRDGLSNTSPVPPLQRRPSDNSSVGGMSRYSILSAIDNLFDASDDLEELSTREQYTDDELITPRTTSGDATQSREQKPTEVELQSKPKCKSSNGQNLSTDRGGQDLHTGHVSTNIHGGHVSPTVGDGKRLSSSRAIMNEHSKPVWKSIRDEIHSILDHNVSPTAEVSGTSNSLSPTTESTVSPTESEQSDSFEHSQAATTNSLFGKSHSVKSGQLPDWAKNVPPDAESSHGWASQFVQYRDELMMCAKQIRDMVDNDGDGNDSDGESDIVNVASQHDGDLPDEEEDESTADGETRLEETLIRKRANDNSVAAVVEEINENKLHSKVGLNSLMNPKIISTPNGNTPTNVPKEQANMARFVDQTVKTPIYHMELDGSRQANAAVSAFQEPVLNRCQTFAPPTDSNVPPTPPQEQKRIETRDDASGHADESLLKLKSKILVHENKIGHEQQRAHKLRHDERLAIAQETLRAILHDLSETESRVGSENNTSRELSATYNGNIDTNHMTQSLFSQTVTSTGVALHIVTDDETEAKRKEELMAKVRNRKQAEAAQRKEERIRRRAARKLAAKQSNHDETTIQNSNEVRNRQFTSTSQDVAKALSLSLPKKVIGSLSSNGTPTPLRSQEDSNKSVLDSQQTSRSWGGNEVAKSSHMKRPSNRKVISNALAHVCLAGPHFRHVREQVLLVLKDTSVSHFAILFRKEVSLKYRGLYAVDDKTLVLRKLHGTGPPQLDDSAIQVCFKYNTGQKCFQELATHSLTKTSDAFVLDPDFVKYYRQQMRQQQQKQK